MATKSTTQRAIEAVDDTAGGMQSLTRQGAGAVKASAEAAHNPAAPAPVLGEAGMDPPARAENAAPMDTELAEILRVLQREGLAELLRALAELDLGDAELSIESLADDMVRGRGRRSGVVRAMVLSQLMQFWLQQQTPQLPKFTQAQQQQFLQIQQTAKVLTTVTALPPAQQAQRVAQILSDPKFAQNLHMAVRQISAPIATPSPRPSINVLAQAMVMQAMAPMRAAITPAQAQNMAARPINMVVLARQLAPVLSIPAPMNRAAVVPVPNPAAAMAALRVLQNSLPSIVPVPMNAAANTTVSRDTPMLRVVSTPAPTPQIAMQQIAAPQTARPQSIAAVFPPRVAAVIAAVTITASAAAAMPPQSQQGNQPQPNVKTATPIITADSFLRREVVPPVPFVPTRDPVAPPMNVAPLPLAVPSISAKVEARPIPSVPPVTKPPASMPPTKDQPPLSAPPQPPRPVPIQNSAPVPAVDPAKPEPVKLESVKPDPGKSEPEKNVRAQTPPASAPPTKDQPPPSAPPQPATPPAPPENKPPTPERIDPPKPGESGLQKPTTAPQSQPQVQSLQDYYKQQKGVFTTQPIPTEVADCCKDKKPKTVFSTGWNFVKGGFGLTKLFSHPPKTAPESAFAIFDRKQPQR